MGKALVRLAAGFVVLVALLLLAAGTTAYWQAWAFMTLCLMVTTLVLLYLLVNDPELLQRRMKTKEMDGGQSLIVKLAAVCYVLAFLVPGLDRRFGWSEVPVVAVLAADLVVLLVYGLFILVLKENRYASRVIEVEAGQHVVTTGPYAVVRHPMYLGMLVMFLFTPVALGSWWAVVSVLPLIAVVVARIRTEERLLARELEGYREYTQTTKYRLIPCVW